MDKVKVRKLVFWPCPIRQQNHNVYMTRLMRLQRSRKTEIVMLVGEHLHIDRIKKCKQNF